MSDVIEGRLKELGFTLPVAAAPAANYVPFTISGNLLYVSGQLPMESGKIAVTGLVGRDVDVPGAQRAAELCAVNILAQVKAALNGDLSKIRRVIKLNGFVASVPEFVEQHLVINGASIFSPMFSVMPANMPAPPSAWPACPSTHQSKSTPSWKSTYDAQAFLADG